MPRRLSRNRGVVLAVCGLAVASCRTETASRPLKETDVPVAWAHCRSALERGGEWALDSRIDGLAGAGNGWEVRWAAGGLKYWYGWSMQYAKEPGRVRVTGPTWSAASGSLLGLLGDALVWVGPGSLSAEDVSAALARPVDYTTVLLPMIDRGDGFRIAELGVGLALSPEKAERGRTATPETRPPKTVGGTFNLVVLSATLRIPLYCTAVTAPGESEAAPRQQ